MNRVVMRVVQKISIHAPHAGSDKLYLLSYDGKTNFNPRSPCGERLANVYPCDYQKYFNPRSPCGERPLTGEAPDRAIKFQSTLPMRGATIELMLMLSLLRISIHAPHAGSDLFQRW